MVFQLLVLGRVMSKYRTPGKHQVGTCIEQSFINHKIFLFPTKGGSNIAYILVKIITNINRSLIQCFQCFQQRSFIIERLARIGNEDRRYA